jgi:hypothetical protein
MEEAFEERRGIYRPNEHRRRLVEIAYQLQDTGDPQNQNLSIEILKTAREIASMTMQNSTPPPNVLRALDTLLKKSGIRYCLIGGMAVNVHSSPRGTEDIDVLVERLPPGEITKDKTFMRSLGFYPTQSRTGSVLVIDHNDGFVECLLADTALKKHAIDHSRLHSVMGQSIRVATAEDVVALKIVAIENNPSRRSDDAQDIAVLFAASKLSAKHVIEFLTKEQQKILQDIFDMRGE